MYSDKFEESKFLRALQALQNGKFEFTPVSPQERRLYNWGGIEGCSLLHTSPQRISKICSISMGRETLLVALPLFRSVSCTTNIHEIAESASISMEKVDYADHNLYRRYVNNRSNQKGSGVNTLIYLVQHLGFLLNLKKSVLQLCQEIEFLSLIVNLVNPTLSLLLQKVQKVQEECTKLCNSSWTPILEFTKRLGLLPLTIQAVWGI